MSVDIEALKRLRETIYIARWWNGWPEAIALLDRTITALERAERVEAAAREADRSYIAGLESEDADGIWQTTEWVAFTAAMTALASVLAPAPEGSDG